jgi:mechanosensitive ion channel-like protein
VGQTANDLLLTFTEFVPRLVGAVAVLLVALVIALLLRRLMGRSGSSVTTAAPRACSAPSSSAAPF